MTADREFLRTTFDSAAEIYQRARPDYPDELFDDLIRLSRLPADGNILEIGCATGKASVPLARRGFRMTCLELGAELAAAARRNLAAFTSVEVINGDFEQWQPMEAFDLVFAATAWHWIDPASRYHRAASLLRPTGHLAFWSATHVFPDGGDPFFVDIQPVYDEIGEGLPPGTGRPRPADLPDERGDIEASGVFDVVAIERYDWERIYDADGYIALLSTFSPTIALDQRRRDHLFGEVRRRLADRPDGLLRRHWGAVLHVARVRPSDAAQSE